MGIIIPGWNCWELLETTNQDCTLIWLNLHTIGDIWANIYIYINLDVSYIIIYSSLCIVFHDIPILPFLVVNPCWSPYIYIYGYSPYFPLMHPSFPALFGRGRDRYKSHTWETFCIGTGPNCEINWGFLKLGSPGVWSCWWVLWVDIVISHIYILCIYIYMYR